VRFGDPGRRLGYARDAVNSYFVFRVMKEKGVLPPHIRFQVPIPMVNSVLPPRIFPEVRDSCSHRTPRRATMFSSAACRSDLACERFSPLTQLGLPRLLLEYDAVHGEACEEHACCDTKNLRDPSTSQATLGHQLV
jgi:hypothetical protein